MEKFANIDEKLLMKVVCLVLKRMPENSPDEIVQAISDALSCLVRENEKENLKNEIIATGKHLYLLGFLAGTSGNISVRLRDNTFLVTASGVCKGQMEAGDILHVDLNGNLLESSPRKITSEAKMHLHSFERRPDIKAIVHAHPPFSTGFAAANLALDVPVLPEAILILGRVPLVEYGTPSTWEVPEKLDPYILKHNVFLLANHGALTFGENLSQAFGRMETLELFAKVLLIARMLGGEKILSKKNLERLLEVHKGDSKKD